MLLVGRCYRTLHFAFCISAAELLLWLDVKREIESCCFLLRIPINPLSSEASAGHLYVCTCTIGVCVCVCIFGLLRAACCADAQFDRTRNLKDFFPFLFVLIMSLNLLCLCVCVWVTSCVMWNYGKTLKEKPQVFFVSLCFWSQDFFFFFFGQFVAF